jgi:hypothetical protein
MTEYLFANNAETTLSTDIGAGDSSFAVANGGGATYPSPTTGQGFYINITEGSKSEWMLVTVRSGDTFSGITRGSSPLSFAAGSKVRLAVNATILGQVLQKGVYRETAVAPNGVLAAAYAGEEVLLTTTNLWYKHTTGTEWKLMSS